MSPEALRICGRSPKTALVCGHPAHLLKLYGWMLQLHPVVCVLTSGSAAPLSPKLHVLLAGMLGDIGAVTSGLIAQHTDQQFYDALLAHDDGFFLAIADALAVLLVEQKIEMVMGDAQEGYNPVHDLCRAIIDTAVAVVQHRHGRTIANYACYLTEWIGDRQRHDSDCVHLELNEQEFTRKHKAADGFSSWTDAIREAVDNMGPAYFRTECLRPVRDISPPSHASPPFYEGFAEERLKAGKYTRVIRYDDHVRPIWNALRAHARAG